MNAVNEWMLWMLCMKEWMKELMLLMSEWRVNERTNAVNDVNKWLKEWMKKEYCEWKN